MSIHAGSARAAISGFIKDLPAYEQGWRNNNNPEPCRRSRWAGNLLTFKK